MKNKNYYLAVLPEKDMKELYGKDIVKQIQKRAKDASWMLNVIQTQDKKSLLPTNVNLYITLGEHELLRNNSILALIQYASMNHECIGPLQDILRYITESEFTSDPNIEGLANQIKDVINCLSTVLRLTDSHWEILDYINNPEFQTIGKVSEINELIDEFINKLFNFCKKVKIEAKPDTPILSSDIDLSSEEKLSKEIDDSREQKNNVIKKEICAAINKLTDDISKLPLCHIKLFARILGYMHDSVTSYEEIRSDQFILDTIDAITNDELYELFGIFHFTLEDDIIIFNPIDNDSWWFEGYDNDILKCFILEKLICR